MPPSFRAPRVVSCSGILKKFRPQTSLPRWPCRACVRLRSETPPPSGGTPDLIKSFETRFEFRYAEARGVPDAGGSFFLIPD